MSFGRTLSAAALALALGACQKPAKAPVAMDSAAVAAAHRGVPLLDPEVRMVASITKALYMHPEIKDSILPAYHLTRAQFDSMKAEVLADSAKRAMYIRLTGDTAQAHPRR